MTTQTTRKTVRKEELRPANVPVQAIRVQGEVDPEKIENGKLWILAPDGTLVNVADSAAAFDHIVSHYVDLFDRERWPLYDILVLFAMAKGAIPAWEIDPEQLPDALREQVPSLIETFKERQDKIRHSEKEYNVIN